SDALELAARNNMREAILRLTLTRGTGRRGYSIAGVEHPNCVMSMHELPERPAAWRLATVPTRLPVGDPLARYKTCNKLLQILARKEAEARGANEALLLNSMGVVAEAAAANIFWIQAGTVCTPPLTAGVLPGVTRAVVMELCGGLSLPVRECEVGREALFQAQGVFLTLSSLGVMPVASLDDAELGPSHAVAQLAAHYDERVYTETT
ncbi:MAG TPA: aminotransferase class IV, partial [Clostridia bacterium]|nr:aminotransferase class IV [Clostridia bacterium]